MTVIFGTVHSHTKLNNMLDDQELQQMLMQENKYTEYLGDEEDDQELKKGLVDMSKLLEGHPDAANVRQMGRDVIICNNISQVQAMFEKANIMKGIKPIDMQKSSEASPSPEPAKEPTIFKIPPEEFEEFKDVNDLNEDWFMFTAYNLVITYLEQVCLKVDSIEQHPTSRWDVAIEFPDNIPTMGRSKLHEVANYFKLAHHTAG